MEGNTKPAKGIFGSKSFSVGTLTYTRGALITVLFWMLWADLCLQIMEQLPNIIPLQLDALGASDKLKGIIKDSLQAVLAIFFVPIIGMQSDRHRGPMGRRRPFLLWCTFPVCIFLILLGFAAPISAACHRLLSAIPGLGEVGAASVGITLIAIFTLGFFFFNNYILQVYQYLIADVVPKEVMGSFIGFYRAIGAVGAFVFNYWVLGEADTSPEWIYTTFAILYAVSFLLLVWRVKEGEYPEPEVTGDKPGPVAFVRRYAKECFTHSFYLKIFSVALFFWAAWVPFMTFIIFYATKDAPGYAPSLGIDVDAFGKIKAWTSLPQIIIFALCGPLIDKFHSLRILLVGIIFVTVTFFLGFFLTGSSQSFLIWWLVNQSFMAFFQLAYLAMFPTLFPRDKYGQFFSANQLFFSIGLVFASFLCGSLMDAVKDYRYLFIWSGCCAMGAMFFAFSLFRHWKRLGGDEGYVAPNTSK